MKKRKDCSIKFVDICYMSIYVYMYGDNIEIFMGYSVWHSV